MENGAFFVPWFDKDGYIEGINGKKLLVLGASFYCNQDGKRNERCEYYDDCTINQNTRKYDLCCRIIMGDLYMICQLMIFVKKLLRIRIFLIYSKNF